MSFLRVENIIMSLWQVLCPCAVVKIGKILDGAELSKIVPSKGDCFNFSIPLHHEVCMLVQFSHCGQ